MAWYFHHKWFDLQCKWFSDTVPVLTPSSWCNFRGVVLRAFKWDNLVTLLDGLRMLVGNGCLWVFQHKVPVTLEIKRILIVRWFNNINLYMWNLSSFARRITNGNRKRFKNIFTLNLISITWINFTRNIKNVMGWSCYIEFHS